jgi:hypothetical protein
MCGPFLKVPGTLGFWAGPGRVGGRGAVMLL